MAKPKEIVSRRRPEAVKASDFRVLNIPYRIVTAEERRAKKQS